jgi:hypothetical protein
MVTSGTQIAGSCVRTVSHLYLNSDYCIDSLVCIVSSMKRLASLAAMTMLVTGGFGVAQVAMRDAYARSNRGRRGKREAFWVFALSERFDASGSTETGEKWIPLQN